MDGIGKCYNTNNIWSLYRTYKELKQNDHSLNWGKYLCLYRTYKELKQTHIGVFWGIPLRLYRTYKELKHIFW